MILDVVVTPFEPPAMGQGQDKVEKKERVAKAIQERLPPTKLAELQVHRADRVVAATVSFFLWRGTPQTSITRSVKDLDGLLEVLFDAIKRGPPGIGIIASDSYVCRVNASKVLVEKESQEGFRLTLEEIEDEEMLQTLRRHRQ